MARFKFFGLLVLIGILLNTSPKAMGQRISSTSSPQEVTELARQGDHYAQYLLGRMHYEGSNGLPQDMQKAVNWFSESVSNHGQSAWMYLSACHKDGDGVSKNLDSATRFSNKYLEFFNKDLMKRAARGDDEAKQELDGIYHLELGRIYYHRGVAGSPAHLKDAVKQFELAEASGNADSLPYLAACCLDGTGTSKNAVQAAKYLDAYMNLRYPELLTRLKDGDGNAKREISTVRNYVLGKVYWDDGGSYWLEGRKKAVQYLSAAAAEHHESSLSILAMCYDKGFGVRKDPAKARELFAESDKARNARLSEQKLATKTQSDKFLASENSITMEQIRSPIARWQMIDPIIGFKLTRSEGPSKLLNDKVASLQEDVKLAAQELEKFKELIERAVILNGRLTEEGIRKKIELERALSQAKARLSVAMDQIEDLESIKRLSAETKVIPGEQRALNAAATHGVYSYEHVCALLWQARQYSLVIDKPYVPTAMAGVLQKIQSDRYLRVTSGDDEPQMLAYNDDSERLLAAGVLMFEVNKIFHDPKKLVPTDSEKAHVKSLLAAYQYLLDDMAKESDHNANKRKKDAKSALAFSWNCCRKLIDAK